MNAASLVVGIDLGSAGAAALLSIDGALLDVVDLPLMPTGPACRPSVSAPLFADIVRGWAPGAGFIEAIGPRPTDGPVGSFAFGNCKGTVEAVLATLGISVTYIAVQTWKRHHSIPAGKDQKDRARATAARLWPSKAALFARARDDGRAEASLVGRTGILRGRP